MQVVLLSGGSGTRLWPISIECCPKQFVPFLKDNESMLKLTYKNVKKFFSTIYIATQYNYVKIIKEQIKENINLIIEPSKIGTFAAILNIAAYFKYVECLSDEEVISVIPTDHDVNSDFYKILNTASLHLKASNSNICLIGIKPSFPSPQYGYIIHKNDIVTSFYEKPNTEVAKKLIKENALWNSGILVFKLKYIIDISKKYFIYNNYEEFVKLYSTLPKNSFDREVLEKIKDIDIIESNNDWNDLGTWETLSEKISIPDKYNTNIINLEDKEIRNNGVKNAIIVNCENGISLINKNIDKKYWTNWGYYKVIGNYNTKVNNIKIKFLNIIKGYNISYQYHKFRSETWYILNGKGQAIIGNKLININPGDVLNIPKKQLHSICATEDIQIVEVQYGLKNLEKDVVKIEKGWFKILSLIKGKSL